MTNETRGAGVAHDVFYVGTVRAPVDKVWSLYRAFGPETMKWWRDARQVSIDSPGRDEVGCVRTFVAGSGYTYEEKLSARDDQTRTLRYHLVSASPALPLESTDTAVSFVADGAITRVTWCIDIQGGGIFRGQAKATLEAVGRAMIGDLDRWFNPSLGTLEVKVLHGTGLARTGLFEPDPYVVADLDDGPPQATATRYFTRNPRWDEPLGFDVTSDKGTLNLAVLGAKVGQSTPLGGVSVDIHDLVSGTATTRELQLGHGGTGTLTVSLLLTLNDGKSLPQTEEVKHEQMVDHLLTVLDTLKKEGQEVLLQVTRGEPAKYGYARYPRVPRYANLPLEELPRMVDGLPPGQMLSPDKLTEMHRRTLQYIYSQREYFQRLQKGVDPYKAPFGEWIKLPEPIADHCDEDAELCRQLLQGANPMTIRTIKTIDEVPVSMRNLEAKGKSVKQLLDGKRLFLLDYQALTACSLYEDMFFYAPLMVVHREDTPGGSRLAILGIQLTRNAGENQVYTPASSIPNRYLLAKRHVACADIQYQEWIFHLGLAHLVMEPFAIAAHNALPATHPIGRLLLPHFRETIGINFLARRSLVSYVTPFTDRVFSTGSFGALRMVLDSWKAYDFFKSSFPEDMKARGFDEAKTDGLENYLYREDGFKIWNVLTRYVRGVVEATYKDDAAVANDPVICEWVAESTAADKADIPGFPEAIGSRDLLVRTLTTIIFQQTAYHSAVNYSQMDYQSYMPNRASALFKPMPDGAGDISADYLKSAMPNPFVTHFQAMFSYVLTLPATIPLSRLDAIGSLYPAVQAAFRKELEGISREISARNQRVASKGEATYPFLDPANIASSVEI